jgi:hypothetical protein
MQSGRKSGMILTEDDTISAFPQLQAAEEDKGVEFCTRKAIRATNVWQILGAQIISDREVCVREVVLQGLHLVPRLTPQAREELQVVLTIVNNTSLADRPDTRHCFLADHTGNFQTSTLYNLLKGSLGHGDVSTTFI